MEELVLYVVRNHDGKYFRATGYSGSDKHWVDNLNEAKLYTKLSYARRQVTIWADYKGKHKIPYIVVLTATITDIINEYERVQKVKKEKFLAEHRQKVYDAEWRLKKAQDDIYHAKKEMEEAKKILNNS